MDPSTVAHVALKAKARGDIENVMNKYEYMMSHDQFQYVYDNLFTHSHEDVRFELPFGKWVGLESLKRGIIGFHSQLCLDDQGHPRPGVFFYNANTQAIVEVADDLKTAKGLWICPGFGVPDIQNPDGTVSLRVGQGTAKRAADFVFDEREKRWKIWHYLVTGMTSHRYMDFFGVASQSQTDRKFGPDTRPDGPPDFFWMYSKDARVEYFPHIPEPYETWAETFSY